MRVSPSRAAAKVFGIFLAGSLVCSGQTRPPAGGHRAPGANQAGSQSELLSRVGELERAKTSRDATEITRAGQQVVALALRELARLRLLESATPQAVKLYEKSLELEDSVGARTDLAIALLQLNRPDEAIQQANDAVASSPANGRAYSTLGSALMFKKEYARAAVALSKSIELAPDIETQYYLGIAYLSTGDAKDKQTAAKVFQDMTKTWGESGSLHVMFGRAYRDAQDMPSAIREFERAIQIDTRTPHAHYFLGLARLAVNEWNSTPEIISEFRKELAYYPQDYLANYMLGFDAFNHRMYDECDKYLKKAAGINPEAPDAWLYLGLNAYAKEQWAEAEQYLRKAIELTGSDEGRSNYQIRRAYIDLGRMLNSSGRKEEATVYLDKARELQKKILETTQQGMASHFAEEGAAGAAGVVPLAAEKEQVQTAAGSGDVDPFTPLDAATLARSSLTKPQKQGAAIQEKQLRGALVNAYMDVGTSFAVRGQYEQALANYREAERWAPETPGLARNLGVAAFRLQDYGEASKGLAAALEGDPKDATVRAMLGMSYFGQERYKEAAATFGPLGPPGMKDPAVGYAWAASLAKEGDANQASQVLDEFSRPSLPADVLMLVGQLWIEIEDYAKAVSTFERVLRTSPGTSKAHYFAGQAYLRWNHWPEAAREFQAELALHPSDVEAKFNLGFVYLQQSRQADAEKLFLEVIDAQPEHASAQYEYGKILLDHGDLAGAIRHLEIAARLKPNTDYVHYQLQVAYRKDGRITDADRELEIYKQIKAKKRERATEAVSGQQTP